MHHFAYRNGVLHAEAVNLASLAQAVDTPFYCYSTATLERHYRVFAGAFADVPSLLPPAQGQFQPGGDRDIGEARRRRRRLRRRTQARARRRRAADMIMFPASARLRPSLRWH